MQRILALLTVTLISFLAGCTSAPVKREIDVSVNAFTSPDAETLKNFIVLPLDSKIPADDFEFQEYAHLTAKILESTGFIKAENKEAADIAVFLTYNIGDPDEKSYTYSVPHFGQTGVSSSTTTGSVMKTGSGSASYNATTTTTPTFGVTGYSEHTGTYTTFTRQISLTGIDLKYFREKNEVKKLWFIKSASIGPSADLRKVVPYMLVAMRPYIGKSTQEIIETSIVEDDPLVLSIKGVSAPVPSP